MQFNLVNDQEKVVQFVWCGVVWRGVAWRGVAQRCVAWRLALGFTSILRGCLQRLQRGRVVSPCGAFPVRRRAVLGVSGSFAYQACSCACPHGFCLAQRSVWWRSCAFQYFPSLLALFRGVGASPQQICFFPFSIKLTVQCDGCLIWGLGWWAGLVAAWRVGQAYGVFHRPGFGLLVSVPRSLSTHPPFATPSSICDTGVNTNLRNLAKY